MYVLYIWWDDVLHHIERYFKFPHLKWSIYLSGCHGNGDHLALSKSLPVVFVSFSVTVSPILLKVIFRSYISVSTFTQTIFRDLYLQLYRLIFVRYVLWYARQRKPNLEENVCNFAPFPWIYGNKAWTELVTIVLIQIAPYILRFTLKRHCVLSASFYHVSFCSNQK